MLETKEQVRITHPLWLHRSRPWLNMGCNQDRVKQGQDLEEEEGLLYKATMIIAGCVDDMEALWDDPVVQKLVTNGSVNLSDSAQL